MPVGDRITPRPVANLLNVWARYTVIDNPKKAEQSLGRGMKTKVRPKMPHLKL